MNLRSLSAHLKTDLSYIIKGSSAMVTGQSLVSLIGLLSSVAFANLLSKETYGTYQYVLTIAEFVTVFSLTGLTQSIIRSVARGYEGSLRHSYQKGLLWSIPACLIGIGISVYEFSIGNTVLAWCVLIAAVGGPLVANAKLYLNYLIGKKLFSHSSTYSVIGNAIPTLVMISALWFTENLIFLVLTYFSAHYVTHTILHYKTVPKAENNTIDTETIPYAFHLSAQNMITRIAAELDKILLFHFAGAVAVAEYFFAITIPRQFQHFFKSAKMIVLPKVSTQSFETLKKSLPQKILLVYFFVIPALLCYWLVSPYIFHWFFPAYENAVFFSQVYALIFLFLPLTLFQDAIIGHAKQRILYKTNVISALVKITTTALLVPPLGIPGVLASLLLSQAFTSLQMMYYFYREPDNTPTIL